MKVSQIRVFSLLLVLAAPVAAESTPTIFQKAEAANPANPDYRFLWRTEPGVRYHLQTSENLSTWTDVPGYPKRAEGPVEFHDLAPVPGGKQFAKATLIDEQAPVLVESYPQDGAIGVPRFEDFEIQLRDASGINPASISLTIGAQSAMTLASTPGLTFVDGVLRYDAVDTAHGVAGAVISVVLSVADTVGNGRTFSWSLTLQEQAVERVADIYVFGSAAAQRDGQRLSARQRAMAESIIGSVRLPASGGADYELSSITPTSVVISYTGEVCPVLGTYIANHSPTRREEVFCRRVLSRADDTASKTLTLQTEDVTLPEIVDGTVSVSSVSKIYNVDEAGNIQPALELTAGLTFPTIGLPVGGLVGTNFELKNQDDFTVARITATELKFQSTPSMQAGIRTSFGKLQEMNATIKARHDFAAVFDVEALLASVKVTRPIYDLTPEPHKFMYLGQLGPMPVFVDLVFDCQLNFTTQASAALTAKFGFRRIFDQGVTLSYKNGGAVSLTPFSIPIKTETIPFKLDLTGSLESEFRLEPRLEFLVYGVAGVGASIEPWAKVSFVKSTDNQPLQATFGVGVDLVAEPVGVVFDLLGESLSPSLTVPLWKSPEWDLLTAANQLAVAITPDTGGDTWTMEHVLSGTADSNIGQSYFTYNGNPIPGSNGPTCSLPPSAYAGTFGAAAVSLNGTGQTIVSPQITPPTPPAPTGFERIPAGNFEMGQTGIATPVHTVYVSDFYMAKYETTKELWDEVRAWGLTHGYTDLAVGNGGYASKGADHPVHWITWYDMVKWCNARSEKENLTPCYTVSGATYQTGQNAAVVCNFGASGYRLPTEAEWEKAARGGQTGYNFPWGNEITHDQANYYSSTSYTYDKSLTRGYHPSYTAGGYPYTARVDSFTPNAYGLYNMSGNVWEWCWDWYGSYPSASQTNPTGATTGSNRVVRGGSWSYDASHARCASRFDYNPYYADYYYAFRLARGQP